MTPINDYGTIQMVCNQSSAFSRSVIDEFLMHYAVRQEGLEKEMDRLLAPFRQVTKTFQPGWIGMIKAQYIAHRIFRKDGLIKKYLNHAAVKALKLAEQDYLQRQLEFPWRYSYGVITASPAPDFYEMNDVFSWEPYLLYSQSITQTLAEGPVSLWFNLIGFNGACWQTFGPIINFRGFEPDDIFFFATEINPKIATEEDLTVNVERNPIPYTMLVNGSQYPYIMNGKDQILQLVSDHPLESLDTENLRTDFTVEYSNCIYRLTFGNWAEPPHFAVAYYVEEDHRLLLTSMTDRGFQALVARLNNHGLAIWAEPDIRVNLPMLTCIKTILGKELHLNPYEEYFSVKPTASEQDSLNKLNRLLSLALPLINSGQAPNIPALAKEVGVDEGTARDLLSKSIKRVKTLQNRIDKKRKK
jgi:hypothetical protein